jgi:hypothetical protein
VTESRRRRALEPQGDGTLKTKYIRKSISPIKEPAEDVDDTEDINNQSDKDMSLDQEPSGHHNDEGAITVASNTVTSHTQHSGSQTHTLPVSDKGYFYFLYTLIFF